MSKFVRERAQEIIAEARDLSAAERSDFIARACGENQELRAEVNRFFESRAITGDDGLGESDHGD